MLEPLQSSANDEIEGAPQMMMRSAMRSSREHRADLLRGLVVTGGSSAIQGTPERLESEVRDMLQASAPHWEVSAAFIEPARRSVTNWIGGSIVANLSSFDDEWISKAMYDEHGAERIYECP